MLYYSKYKINLGLSVMDRREDGHHDIRTVMIPVDGSLCDTVELIESRSSRGIRFSSSGIEVDCPAADNLCVRAFRLMQDQFSLPDVAIHLHKRIPFGAGLGAGSANAVAVIKLADCLFNLTLTSQKMEQLAAQLGSDTPFFVNFRSALASGRGEILTPLDIDLRGYYLLLVKPDIGISTAQAYSIVTPATPEMDPAQAVKYPIGEWHRVLENDFEKSVFERLPVLSMIKSELYRAGAIYASMSGSGSTIYGIFDTPPALNFRHFTHLTRL